MVPKFRAWDKRYKMMMKVNQIDFEKRTVWLEADNGDHENRHTLTREVQEVILMQSIEINGLEISDGDIVHVLDSKQVNQIDENGAYFDAYFDELDEIDHVVFDDGSFKLKRIGLDVCICRSVEEFRVIGNIYENPELLEVK